MKTIHLAERGLEPRNTLCHDNTTINEINFEIKKVTCLDCIKMIQQGIGFSGKCFYCKHNSYPKNKAYYSFCIADPKPKEVKFEHGNYLNQDARSDGCITSFTFKRRWINLFEKRLSQFRIKGESQK